MRQIADVQTISSNKIEGIYDNDEASAGWVSELGSRSDSNTPQVGKWEIEAYEMYAMPKASQRILDDAAVDVESWLAMKVADKLARVEGTAFGRVLVPVSLAVWQPIPRLQQGMIPARGVRWSTS